MLMALAVLALLLCCLPALVEGPGDGGVPLEPVQPTAAVIRAEGYLLPQQEGQPQPTPRVRALPAQPERLPLSMPARDSNGHPIRLTAAYVDAVPEAFPPESVKG